MNEPTLKFNSHIVSQENGSHILRTEELDEVISKEPSGIILIGSTIILLIFALLLAIAWFVHYPDVIAARVVVTTTPAPINLVTRTSGKLTLLKKDNYPVKEGEVLAAIETTVGLEQVSNLESTLSLDENDPAALVETLSKRENLGDLQVFVNGLIESASELARFNQKELYSAQIVTLKKHIASYNRLTGIYNRQLGLLKQEAVLVRHQFGIDSILLVQKVITALDLNKSMSLYLQHQRSLQSMEISIVSNQLQIEALDKQIQELTIEYGTRKSQLETNYKIKLQEVSAQILDWKETFLLRSPIDGKVMYLGFLENEQFVDVNKPVLSIVPYVNHIIANAELPIEGAGKVIVGNSVNIQLQDYPHEQFGMLEGLVKKVSPISNNENYLVHIDLQHGMKSTFNKDLSFKPQLLGKAEIVTEDLRILERFFYQFRKILKPDIANGKTQ